METLLGIAVLVVIIWAFARARYRRSGGVPARRLSDSSFRSEIDAAVSRDYAPAAPSGELRKAARKSDKEHVPPTPSGRAVEAWSPRTLQLEVAGEWYRAEDLRTLFTRHAKVSDAGAEIRLDAVLVPDPSNPFDNHAVAVFVDGLHVGYMERSDAASYQSVIAKLPDGELAVPSRQWLRGTAQDTWARVTLSLPRPDQLCCPNPSTENSVVLAPGATIQVTREEDHMEHLAPLLRRYGSETVVAASLRAVTKQRPRSTVEVVAVDIDGRQVGVLSPTQTANLLPLVRRAESEGRSLICRASLRGNSLKADVALHARKAHEMDDAELEYLFATNHI
jgi:collagen type III alpha